VYGLINGIRFAKFWLWDSTPGERHDVRVASTDNEISLFAAWYVLEKLKFHE